MSNARQMHREAMNIVNQAQLALESGRKGSL